MLKVMQNRDLADQELPKAKEYADKYLTSVPEPISPLKAHAPGTKARIEMFLGNNAGSKILTEQAKPDPCFSRGFGIPSLALYEPPVKTDHYFQSFF